MHADLEARIAGHARDRIDFQGAGQAIDVGVLVPMWGVRLGRIGHRNRVPVGDHRVDANIDDQVDVVVVRTRTESGETAHQARHQCFRRAVDGQRAEARRGAQGRLQRLGCPVARPLGHM